MIAEKPVVEGAAKRPEAKADGSAPTVSNVPFDEIQVGLTASVTHRVTMADIELFAAVSHNHNPLMLDAAFADAGPYRRVIAHGMWSASLLSGVLGSQLPGYGTVYRGQNLQFLHHVGLGDTITASVTVVEKNADTGSVVLRCLCENQDGVAIVRGTAEV
ncbi:enoyl-CoA hydratase, partial [Rubrivivax gelatinosus]|nr:enoyl-CoA hydratase [Rubrivivax gelatinosus]